MVKVRLESPDQSTWFSAPALGLSAAIAPVPLIVCGFRFAFAILSPAVAGGFHCLHDPLDRAELSLAEEAAHIAPSNRSRAA